jgi:4-amino-4-deoxy-L-arabinose transferase-like glycosyltransferase
MNKLRLFLTRNKWIAIIIAASIIGRIAAALMFGNVVTDLPGTFDQISYNTLAMRVLGGFGFSFGEVWWPITPAGAPTAHWSFLYTLYLTGIYLLFGPFPLVARILQAIITGFFHPLLAYKIGGRLYSKTVGLVAAALTAGYLYFVYYDATLMTEPFFITLVLAGLYMSIWIVDQLKITGRLTSFSQTVKLFLVLGLVLGAAVLLRQLIMVMIPFVFLWILYALRKNNLRLVILNLLVSAGVILAMILPFSIYNTIRFKHFVLLNTNSGYAFFWSNHPIYGTTFVPLLTEARYQDLVPTELRSLDEAALDQALMQRGFQIVLSDPGRYLLLSLSRIPVFFMFWPSSGSGLVSNLSRVGSFGILWPFMLYGLIRAVYLRRKVSFLNFLATPEALLILFGVIYTGMHLLSWAMVRYRLPVDAVTLTFAALAIVDLAQRYINWRKSKLQLAKS